MGPNTVGYNHCCSLLMSWNNWAHVDQLLSDRCFKLCNWPTCNYLNEHKDIPAMFADVTYDG